MPRQPQLIPFLQKAALHPEFRASIYASQLHVQLPSGFDVTELSGSDFFYTQDPFTKLITMHISFPSLVKDVLASTHYLTLDARSKPKAWRTEVKAPHKDNLSL